MAELEKVHISHIDQVSIKEVLGPSSVPTLNRFGYSLCLQQCWQLTCINVGLLKRSPLSKPYVHVLSIAKVKTVCIVDCEG